MTEQRAEPRPRIQVIDVTSLVSTDAASARRVAAIRQRLQRMFPRRAAPYDDSDDPLEGLVRPAPSTDETLAAQLDATTLD